MSNDQVIATGLGRGSAETARSDHLEKKNSSPALMTAAPKFSWVRPHSSEMIAASNGQSRLLVNCFDIGSPFFGWIVLGF